MWRWCEPSYGAPYGRPLKERWSNVHLKVRRDRGFLQLRLCHRITWLEKTFKIMVSNHSCPL